MQVLSASFQQKFNRSQFNYMTTLLPIFMAKHKVPWIMKWNYEVETSEVYKARLVKWWDKFNHQKTISQVITEFPITPLILAKLAQPSLPTISEQLLSDISPLSSLKGTIKSSKSISSKSKKSHPTQSSNSTITCRSSDAPY